MTGELIPTGVTFGVGRNSINDAFSGTAILNNITLDSGGDFSGGNSGGVIQSGGTDLYSIFATEGESSTASNGLTKTGDNITLGGTLTGGTVINGGGSYSLTIKNATQFQLDGTFFDVTGGDVSINNSSVYLGNAVDFSGGTGGGVIYSGGTDLYNIFSTSDSTTANNGITKSGDHITLGGGLTGDTTITTDSNTLYIDAGGGTGSVSFSGDGSSTSQIEFVTNFLPGEPASLQVGKGSARLVATSGITDTYLVVNGGVIQMRKSSGGLSQQLTFTSTTDDIILTDGINSRGIEYALNYHANYTNRTLVDYEYVNNHVASATTSSMSSSGGTATEDFIYDLGSTYQYKISGNSASSEQINLETNFGSSPARLTVGRSVAQLESDSGTSVTAQMRVEGGIPRMYKSIGGVDQRITFDGTNAMLVKDDVNLRGLEYNANYHGNYTNRTLVDYEYVNNHVASATTGGGVSIDPYNDLGDVASSFTWNVSGDSTNYEVTLTAATTTVNLTNVRDGEYGTLIVNQDTVGGRAITFGNVNGAGATHKVVNTGGGSATLTATANAIDILTFTYNGSTMFWSVGNDYT